MTITEITNRLSDIRVGVAVPPWSEPNKEALMEAIIRLRQVGCAEGPPERSEPADALPSAAKEKKEDNEEDSTMRSERLDSERSAEENTLKLASSFADVGTETRTVQLAEMGPNCGGLAHAAMSWRWLNGEEAGALAGAGPVITGRSRGLQGHGLHGEDKAS